MRGTRLGGTGHRVLTASPLSAFSEFQNQTKGQWGGDKIGRLNSAEWYDSYRQLQQLGLEVVPTLLEHTHDFRMIFA